MSNEGVLDTVSEAFHYLQDSNLASVLTILLEAVTDEEFSLKLLSDYQHLYDRIIKISLSDNDTDDRSIAIQVLINMSSHTSVCEKILSLETGETKKELLIWMFLKQFTKSQKMMFQRHVGNFITNLTRMMPIIMENESAFLSNTPVVNSLLKVAFVKSHRPPDGSVFERWPAARIALNMSQLAFFRRYILENIYFLNDVKFLLAQQQPVEWKRATFGLIRNLLRSSDDTSIYSTNCCILSTILFPLIGMEKYEAQDSFPVFLPEPFAVTRIETESDPELRLLLLDALYLFCATSTGRETMRDAHVYDILKRLHENRYKMNLNTQELDRCEGIIGLLIRDETEIGALNLLEVDIPGELETKLNDENCLVY